MWGVQKNTAESRAAMQEAKTWKSRANATTRCVHSYFGTSRLEVPLTWPADNDRFGRTCREVTRYRQGRIDREIPKTEFIAFAFLVPCVSHSARRIRRTGGRGRGSGAGSYRSNSKRLRTR